MKLPPCDKDCLNCTRPVEKCRGGGGKTANADRSIIGGPQRPTVGKGQQFRMTFKGVYRG